MDRNDELPKFRTRDFVGKQFIGNGANVSVFLARRSYNGEPVVVVLNSDHDYRFYNGVEYDLDRLASDAEEDGVTLCPLAYALAHKAMAKIKDTSTT